MRRTAVGMTVFAVGLVGACASPSPTSDCPAGPALTAGVTIRITVIDDPANDEHTRAVAELIERCIQPIEVIVAEAATTAELASSVTDAASAGSEIILPVLGTPVATPELAAAIDFAVRSGSLVVAPAGNTGAASPTLGDEQPIPFVAWNEPIYPAAYDGVIAVGAVDEAGAPADFSQDLDYVRVAAPGVTIDTDAAGIVSGTSYAAPQVAAAVAFFVAQEFGPDPAEIQMALAAALGPESADGVALLDTSRLRSRVAQRSDRAQLGRRGVSSSAPRSLTFGSRRDREARVARERTAGGQPKASQVPLAHCGRRWRRDSGRVRVRDRDHAVRIRSCFRPRNRDWAGSILGSRTHRLSLRTATSRGRRLQSESQPSLRLADQDSHRSKPRADP